MKLAALAVSLLVAVIAAVGSLLSQTSRSTVASDILVLELSQKIQDQDAKLSKTEEALRQLNSDSSGRLPNAVDRSRQLSRVSNLQTKIQQSDDENYRLSLLYDQISKEQARLDAWQKQSDLTKHRLDQDEKVLGLEVMVKALDNSHITKPQSPQRLAVLAPNVNKSAADLYGETPFVFPAPAVQVTPDYSSLQDRHTQLQTDRKQWASDKHSLVQAKSQLNCQLVSYNKKFRTASKNQQKLEDEARSLKNQGFALKAKS